MEELPAAGHLAAVDRMFLLTGGCAANVAVNVAKQRVPVGVIGKVGNDVWGRFICEDLTARGVDMSRVAVSDEYQTSQSMVLLCRGQDRRFVHTFGANRALRGEDLSRDYIAGAEVFYLGGYLVLPELDPDAVAATFRFCQERGIRTVLDVVIPTDFEYGGELEPILPYTDVFLPNNVEAEILTGLREPQAQARAIAGKGTRTVLVTMGEEGIVISDSDSLYEARPFRVEEVDQTGAGDAFAAGYISGMVTGRDVLGCVAYGSALGSSCVSAIGCSEGVFTPEGAERFLAENPLAVRRID